MLRDYQIELLPQVLGSKAKSVCAQAPTGTGKCLGKDTPVLMFDGTTKPVQDVRVGDLLMGPDSAPRTVVSVCRGQEEMFNIIPVRGEPFTCNKSHILSLKRTGTAAYSNNDAYATRRKIKGSVVNISVADYLQKSTTFKHTHKLWRTGVEFSSPTELKIDPYFLGLWLGDGDSNRPTITNIDKEIVSWLHKNMSDDFNVECRKPKNRCQRIYITDKIHRGSSGSVLMNKFKSYSLINNKHIPHDYKVASREYRLALLAGIVDTDGSLQNGGYYITQKNRTLAYDIVFLARSLGFGATISCVTKKCYNNGKTGLYYNVTITGHINSIPCKVSRKIASHRVQKKDPLHVGFKVESIGLGDYYGFEIEGPDRLFLLGDFTVTHNTTVMCAVAQFYHGKKILFIAHRQRIIRQIHQRLATFGIRAGIIAPWAEPTDDLVQVASIQTISRRDARKVDIIIVDECFPFGTLIDGKPIEQIKVGDVVRSFNHETNQVEMRPVVRLFKSKPSVMYRINGIACTAGHPFYTQRGYVAAHLLTKDDMVLTITQQENLHELQNMQPTYGRQKKNLFRCVQEKIKCTDNGINKQNSRIRQDDRKKPHEKSRGQRSGQYQAQTNWTQTQSSRRQWQAASSCASIIGGCFGLGNRGTNKNWALQGWLWLSNLLQNRHSKQTTDDWYRGRRQQSLRTGTAGSRQEERGVFAWRRVEHIEVLEQTGDGRFGGVCPDGFVYNIEVEKNHNYFVENTLVHNCHHSVASNYRKIFSSYEYEKHYGFTATPERLDGRGLGEVYEELITTHSPAWFIKNGYLAPYKYYMSRPDQQVNLSSLGVRAGEFKMEQAAQYFSTSTVYGNIVDDWKRLGQDGQTVGFACTINQATELANKFNESGIPSAVIHGKMSAEEQEVMLSQFDALQIRVLWSVDVLGEGVDLPECQVAILARPTLSLSVYLQQVGRVLRPKKDGRYAIIIDHALNLSVHDYPCVQRNWTLEGQKRKDRKVEKKDFKVCRACGYVNAPDSGSCEECQTVFAKPRVIVNKTATTVSMDAADNTQDKGQDFGEYIKLLHYAAKKGYNHGWAYHQAIQKGIPILPFHAGKNLYAKFRKQYYNQESY